ncbi:MAG: hypothetical protein LC127_14390 [Chitinophagales bacterium]|nr:hypothetical protein [Chitinophagales bacterium]
MTPKELAVAVKDVLMSKPNKGIIFPSFLTGVEDRGKFIEHCVKYLDGMGIVYYEGLQKVCQEKIDGLLKSEIEKEGCILFTNATSSSDY